MTNKGDDIKLRQRTLSEFHGALNQKITRSKHASLILQLYGGDELIHGHTPIPYATDMNPEAVTQARIDVNRLRRNVDGGVYIGSSWFAHIYTSPSQILG